MAVRATRTSGSRSDITPVDVVASALAGLKIYWSEPQEPYLLEWEKWLELLSASMIAKHSFSLPELTRVDGSERMLALLGGLSEETAGKMVKRFLFILIGQATRKTLMDKLRATQIATITLPVLLDHCWTNHCCETE